MALRHDRAETLTARRALAWGPAKAEKFQQGAQVVEGLKTCGNACSHGTQ
jgi:hypothetical protein